MSLFVLEYTYAIKIRILRYKNKLIIVQTFKIIIQKSLFDNLLIIFVFFKFKSSDQTTRFIL